MTTRIDDLLSARFQACALNYNDYIRSLFGEEHGIHRYLSFSLQFSTIGEEQKDLIEQHPDLPANIKSYIMGFDSALTEQEYGSQKFAYRILFVPKTANRKGQADQVIEFVKADNPLAAQVNKQYAVIKETEKAKYLPKIIIAMMHKEGFAKFNMHSHTTLWQSLSAKSPENGLGVQVAGTWYWYDSWVEVVRKHCHEHRDSYT